MSSIADSHLFVAPMSEDGLVTVDVGGCIRTWETALVNLQRSLREWKNMMGLDDGRPLQVKFICSRVIKYMYYNLAMNVNCSNVTFIVLLFIQITKERESGRKADGPKHGKIDPKNAPHHGGNTWAGGTGGSNTAGMQILVTVHVQVYFNYCLGRYAHTYISTCTKCLVGRHCQCLYILRQVALLFLTKRGYIFFS